MNTEFVNVVSQSTGMELEIIKSLHTRKGLAYQVQDNGVKMLLKAIELKAKENDPCNRRRSLMNEAEILRNLESFTHGLYIDSGKTDLYFWLLRKWLDGKTMMQHTSYIRTEPTSNENKRRFIKDIIHMLQKIIELHQVGFLHGDLQPSHFIVDESGQFHLIDLELAVDLNNPNSTYRGALVHFVPPETASRMLVEDKNIPLDMVSEIYSFGAVVFYLYTKVTPVAYGSSMEDKSYDFPFEKQLLAVSEGRIRSFAQAGVDPFPELEQILMKSLAKNRTRRYQTFEELLTELEGLL